MKKQSSVSAAELQKHATEGDCWIVLFGQVRFNHSADIIELVLFTEQMCRCTTSRSISSFTPAAYPN